MLLSTSNPSMTNSTEWCLHTSITSAPPETNYSRKPRIWSKVASKHASSIWQLSILGIPSPTKRRWYLHCWSVASCDAPEIESKIWLSGIPLTTTHVSLARPIETRCMCHRKHPVSSHFCNVHQSPFQEFEQSHTTCNRHSGLPTPRVLRHHPLNEKSLALSPFLTLLSRTTWTFPRNWAT